MLLLVFLQMSTRGRNYATYSRFVGAGVSLMSVLSETGDGWAAEAVFPLGRVTGRIFMVLYCRVVGSMDLPYRIVMVSE